MVLCFPGTVDAVEEAKLALARLMRCFLSDQKVLASLQTHAVDVKAGSEKLSLAMTGSDLTSRSGYTDNS